LLAVAEEELGSYRGRAKARVDRQPGVQIELAEKRRRVVGNFATGLSPTAFLP
jgi:hypothetical protein